MVRRSLPLRSKRLRACLHGLAVAAALMALAAVGACGGGGRHQRVDYYQRVESLLNDTATKRAHVTQPQFSGTPTLNDQDKTQIRDRYRQLGPIFGNAAAQLSKLTAPDNVKAVQIQAVQALQSQAAGLSELAQVDPDIKTLNANLEQHVLPFQRSFEAACGKLQADADAADISVKLSCTL
jgi:hypothetical protein